MAIPQQNVKRMLAYSGIAHIGYMLMGVAAMSAERRRHGALLSGRVSLRQHGRVPRRAGGRARPKGRI
jgi:NADH-quinone oxidoreductase subunit N